MAKTQATTVLRRICDLATAQNAAGLRDPQLLDRFTSRHEEAAFEALVRRHGPLVLGVCRRVLHNRHDAEDAFQATFLVLARKARSVNKHECLGSWLYRVAYHVAVKARARAANRRLRERQAASRVQTDPLEEVTGRELLALLDEELQRLPEYYRAPLVLCYLEGRTRDEAARQLGWSLGTLKRRLEEGRERLRTRLARRGLALSGALLAAGLAQGAATAAVPAGLAASTARAALLPATGTAASAGMAPVAALADAVLQGMFAAKLRMTIAMVLVIGMAGLGAGMLTHQALAQRQAKPNASSEPAPAPVQAFKKQPPASAPDRPDSEDRQHMTVTGLVIGPDGKPVKDARVAVAARANSPRRAGDSSGDGNQVLGQAKADGQGRFRLTVARTSSGRFWEVFAVAGKEGYGLGWQKLSPDAEQPEAVIRLQPEQLIRGRLADLQGQPAAKVRVSVSWVCKSVRGQAEGFSLSSSPRRFPFWPEPVTTDAQGRFALHGLNRDLRVNLEILDDRFARQGLRIPDLGRDKEMRLSLAPAQVIEGRVVCEDTGKPLAHARIAVGAVQREEFLDFAGTQMVGAADGKGRFRLNLPPGTAFAFKVYPPDGMPYLIRRTSLKWPKGVVKRHVELKAPRGVLVRGKVTEATTGKPVAGAGVQFIPRYANNPYLRDDIITGRAAADDMVVSGPDGTFRIVVLPGRGHLLISGPTFNYIHQEIGGNEFDNGRPGGRRHYPDAVVKLDLPAKTATKEVGVQIRQGVQVRGRLIGPDGKVVAHALMFCRLHVWSRDLIWRFPVDVRDGQFEVNGCDPAKSYPVYFLDPKNRWGASVTLSGKQAGGDPVTVRLKPCGKARARFVDPDGKPLRNYRPVLDIMITPGAHPFHRIAGDNELLYADQEYVGNLDRVNYWDGPRTDAEGRCTMPALIPGATYLLGTYEKDGWILKEFTVQAGKTRDLGDVVIKQSE
ncbi:MAG TPA: sigma-70 family RNA polymerase sigma factor [Gemmataceae bacterium]|nr:sigma-70 family RNA polymerase sigma factor [Gemmataceae bacterium]